MTINVFILVIHWINYFGKKHKYVSFSIVFFFFTKNLNHKLKKFIHAFNYINQEPFVQINAKKSVNTKE